MKILHITQLLGVGGLERLIQGLMLQQMKSGHQVALMVYGEDQTWVQRFRDLGLEVITDYKKSNGYDWNLLKVLRKNAVGYDVIHTHDLNPAMYVGPLRALASLGLMKFPSWVHTAHGMDHIIKRPITRWYERVFTRFSDAVVGVASHICKTYRTKIWIPTKRIHQIDNGIAIENHSRVTDTERRQKLLAKYQVEIRGFVWICVSRIVPLKDQRLLLHAAKKMPSSTFLLVGPSGNEAYWRELTQDCPENVVMLGAQDQIPELLSLSDFYVSPSHHEGIPLAVLEAAAQGLPAVLSDIPGHKSLQQGDRPIALFFKVGCETELVAAMRQFEMDALFANKLAQTFHSVVKTHYSQDRMAADYERVYQQVAR